MRLCLFVVPTGHHEASWRLPGSPLGRLYQLDYYSELATAAESAGLDAIFFADAPALRTDVRFNTGGSLIDPVPLLSALAARTSSIGLIATVSTTYHEPYNVARMFSALDHISTGRAGWNIVSTAHPAAGQSFGVTHAPREERYKRAAEFVEVVKQLWVSWGDDAIQADRAGGVWADRSQISDVAYSGHFIQASGPFQSARSPQVWPVLVQAGASQSGRELAAQHGEVIFSVQRDRSRAAEFIADIRHKANAFGRQPDSLLHLPGLSVHVGETRADAVARMRQLDGLSNPVYGLQQIRMLTGVDLTGYDLDKIVDPGFLASAPGDHASRRDEVIDMASDGRTTLRQLLRRIAGARTHKVLAGSASEVADTMEEWFVSEACDGFNLLPPSLPDDLTNIAVLLLPELQRRGLWIPPTQGVGETLRQRLGLPPLEFASDP